MAIFFPVINTLVDTKDHDRILTGTAGSIGKGVLVRYVIGTITQQQLAERGMKTRCCNNSAHIEDDRYPLESLSSITPGTGEVGSAS
ncbi:hypothetical protein NC651_013073 [Populus alba x Populus x berolinensis]|nr:hypothetical protein NC651_013073 [Populus alba x Populus x berolinensis]